MHLALKSLYLLGYSGLFVAGKDAVNANALLLFTVVVNPRYHCCCTYSCFNENYSTLI